MPAWITSLLRDEVTVPMPSAASSTITSRPACASRRAISKTDHPRTDDDAINFVHVSFGSGLVFYPARRASGVGTLGLNPSNTIALFGMVFLQDRLNTFRSSGESPLVKH